MELKECKKLCHRNYRGKVRQVIDKQIEKFFEIDKLDFKLPNHKYKVGDDVILDVYHYLHGVGSNDKAIEFIAKYGIVSKEATSPNAKKHGFRYVSGFWKVFKKTKLREYINNYSGMDIRFNDKNFLVPYKALDEFVEKMRNTDHWYWEAISSMEIRFMPSLARDINQYGFILNIDNEHAKQLNKNNVNTLDYDRSISKHFNKCFLRRKKDMPKLRSETYMNRASYVIFGMNKCFIEGVIVGRKVEKSKTQLDKVKKLFPNCYIANLDGKVVRE